MNSVKEKSLKLKNQKNQNLGLSVVFWLFIKNKKNHGFLEPGFTALILSGYGSFQGWDKGGPNALKRGSCCRNAHMMGHGIQQPVDLRLRCHDHRATDFRAYG